MAKSQLLFTTTTTKSFPAHLAPALRSTFQAPLPVYHNTLPPSTASVRAVSTPRLSKEGPYASTPSTTAYPDRKGSQVMQVTIRIPSRLAPLRSLSKWQLLGLSSLVILTTYRLEYGYAALVLYNTFMTIYVGVPLVIRSPLVGPATKHNMLATHPMFRHRH